MQKVFADTDIVLDLLTARQPFYEAASRLFTLVDKGQVKLYVSALTFSNINYVLRKENSMSVLKRNLNNFRILVNILSVDEKIIDLALQSAFNDFEDAIQYFTAIQNNVPIILTRNLRDFKLAAIPVMTAEDFLKG